MLDKFLLSNLERPLGALLATSSRGVAAQVLLYVVSSDSAGNFGLSALIGGEYFAGMTPCPGRLGAMSQIKEAHAHEHSNGRDGCYAASIACQRR